MMLPVIRNAVVVASLLLSLNICSAQDNDVAVKENTFGIKPATNPFRILTSGKLITIKSTKDIKTIMVWTASGHRIVEQKDVNAATYSFRVSVNEKIFFVMLRLADGKIYSEKIGVQ
jgi:hypothetical protein